MAQVNACLRRTFTFFNLLFAVLGGVIIGLALLLQTLYRTHGAQELEGRTSALILLYVIGGVTMAIAILGAYGAQKEKLGALIVFLVCMVLGSLFTLKIGVSTALQRTMVDELLESKFRSFLPLDKSPGNIQNGVNTLQTAFQCCGLFSYEDWENNIPDSCVCDPEQEMEGSCQRIPNLLLFTEKSVFQEPCFPVIKHITSMVLNIALAVIFSLVTLALLGMVLSSIIIHQMRQKVSRPTVFVTIPAVFRPQPPKYQELYNPPEY